MSSVVATIQTFVYGKLVQMKNWDSSHRGRRVQCNIDKLLSKNTSIFLVSRRSIAPERYQRPSKSKPSRLSSKRKAPSASKPIESSTPNPGPMLSRVNERRLCRKRWIRLGVAYPFNLLSTVRTIMISSYCTTATSNTILAKKNRVS